MADIKYRINLGNCETGINDNVYPVESSVLWTADSITVTADSITYLADGTTE